MVPGVRSVTREEPVEAVGSLTTATMVVDAAAMREALGIAVYELRSTWTDALRRLVDQAEELGVLVMVNGVVGSRHPPPARLARVPRLRPR